MGTPDKKDQVDKAKELYMNYTPRREIADLTGLPESTLKYYISNEWRQVRESTKRDQISTFLSGRNHMLNSISASGLQILENTLKEWAKSGKLLSFDEMDMLSKIMAKMEQISKTATENQQLSEADLEQNEADSLESALALDPMHKSIISKGYPSSGVKNADKE